MRPAAPKALTLTALLVLAGQSQAQAPGVTAFPVMETTVERPLMAIGNLAARQSVDISPEINGRIVGLHFQDGAKVSAKELLLALDDREQSAAVDQSRISYEDSRRQRAYMETLFKRRAISEDELKAQRATVERLKAALQAELALLHHYTLEAPFSGTLSFHDVSVGALINAGTVVTTLDDLRQMKLTFNLPENTLSHIKKGAHISAATDAWPGKTFTGTIDSISPRIDPLSLTFRVRAILDNPESQLLPGILMRITVERRGEQQLVVPARSILFDGNQRYVYVIDDQNQVARRTVTTGQAIDDYIVVLSGLETGEVVVNEGVVKVSDGRRVNILETRPALSATTGASNGDGLL